MGQIQQGRRECSREVETSRSRSIVFLNGGWNIAYGKHVGVSKTSQYIQNHRFQGFFKVLPKSISSPRPCLFVIPAYGRNNRIRTLVVLHDVPLMPAKD
jgi:hypothetical protein